MPWILFSWLLVDLGDRRIPSGLLVHGGGVFCTVVDVVVFRRFGSVISSSHVFLESLLVQEMFCGREYCSL